MTAVTPVVTPTARSGEEPIVERPVVQPPEAEQRASGGRAFDQVGGRSARARAAVERPPVAWVPERSALGEGTWGIKELVVATRWVALALSVAAVGLRSPHRSDIVAAGLLSLLAVARTLWPFEPEVDVRDLKRAGWVALGGGFGEVALCGVLVAVTGGEASAFVMSLAGACFTFGLVMPLLPGALVVVAGLVGLGVAGMAGALTRPLASRYVEELAVLGALFVLGSYSEWLLQKGRESKDGEVERLRNLGEVNRLLLELHAKAVSVPAGLSLRAAVANLAERLRELLEPDVVVLMLAGSGDSNAAGLWEVVLADGVQLPATVVPGELAPALKEAASSLGPVCRGGLAAGEGANSGAWTGLYVPLWARDSLVGLLAVERVRAGAAFSSSEADMVEGVARHAGLALDNARLFRQLREVGAEEERVRIARELHDRVGQSLAYLALSLGTLQEEARISLSEGSLQLSSEIGGLAAEARRVVRELRTKLTDLRSEVTDQQGVSDELEGLLQRAQERSGMLTTLSVSAVASLPAGLAREVARVAGEAINNAERHSGATHLDVSLYWDGRAGELVVADDGRGLAARAALRADAYGILGMRERAEVIGGSLSIRSSAGQGTTVALRWGEAKRG